jgi:predicted amidophosphoribosyltransferase
VSALALCKCEFCEKPFNSFGTNLCADCSHEADDAYKKVRKYIYQNPNKVNFATIIKNTGVTEKMLSYLIDQGRIIIDGGNVGGARCKACGAKTDGDVICEKCRKKLISENLLNGTSQTENKYCNSAGCRTLPLHLK